MKNFTVFVIEYKRIRKKRISKMNNSEKMEGIACK